MDVKSLRDREFNKRVRDVVSRDSNRLRETFDKYDKQCAERMAEIHHMQEKVRFSMRSLAMDKLHINQCNSVSKNHRRSSESRVHSLAKEVTGKTGNYHLSNKRDNDGEESKQTRKDAVEYSKRHRASYCSISSNSQTLEIPSQLTTNRRGSSPFALPGSPVGSPKGSRQGITRNVCFTGTQATGIKPAMSSSCTKDSFMTHNSTNTRTTVFQSSNMLSVNDMRMSTKSPVVKLLRKSADNSPEASATSTRGVSERKRDRDCSPNGLQAERVPVRQRSTSVSYLPNPQVNSQKIRRKLSGSQQKVPLFRTRSNSLPDLLSPDNILTSEKQEESQLKETTNKTVKNSKPIQISRSQTKLDKVDTIDDSPLARSFEEIRHCRYLRSDPDM